MATIFDALIALKATEYTMIGEPSTEAEFIEAFKKVTGEDADGNAILSSDPNEFGVTWAQIQAKITELAPDDGLRELRLQRNLLLQSTDVWALSDRTMTAEQTAYRQALRDLPANSPDAALDADGMLTGVTWPTKP